MADSDVSEAPRLRCEGLTRSYGRIRALRGLGFELGAGQIMALFGDNGAGKSTLIRILSGSERPDYGSIALDGTALDLRTPMDGRRQGIEVVWQDLALATCLDVSENLFLGRESVHSLPLPHLLRPLRKRAMAEQSRSAVAEVGLDESLTTRRVVNLSGAETAGSFHANGPVGEPRRIDGRADGGAERSSASQSLGLVQISDGKRHGRGRHRSCS